MKAPHAKMGGEMSRNTKGEMATWTKLATMYFVFSRANVRCPLWVDPVEKGLAIIEVP